MTRQNYTREKVIAMTTALAEANANGEENIEARDFLCEIGFMVESDGEYFFSQGRGLTESERELLIEACELWESIAL